MLARAELRERADAKPGPPRRAPPEPSIEPSETSKLYDRDADRRPGGMQRNELRRSVRSGELTVGVLNRSRHRREQWSWMLTVRETLRGHAAYPDKVTGDKITRAEPYAAQVEAGNVGIVVAEWNKPFLNEHEVFPNGTLTKDTVDAAAGAFHKLVGSTYDISLSWVGGPGM
jgi:hypothetical protein